jgi:hypothetical protein
MWSQGSGRPGPPCWSVEGWTPGCEFSHHDHAILPGLQEDERYGWPIANVHEPEFVVVDHLDNDLRNAGSVVALAAFVPCTLSVGPRLLRAQHLEIIAN